MRNTFLLCGYGGHRAKVPGNLPGARRLSVWNGGDIQSTYWTLRLGNNEPVGGSYPEVLENVEAFLNGEI